MIKKLLIGLLLVLMTPANVYAEEKGLYIDIVNEKDNIVVETTDEMVAGDMDVSVENIDLSYDEFSILSDKGEYTEFELEGDTLTLKLSKGGIYKIYKDDNSDSTKNVLVDGVNKNVTMSITPVSDADDDSLAAVLSLNKKLTLCGVYDVELDGGNITETDEEIPVTVKVPSVLKNTDPSLKREFKVYREYLGKIEEVEGVEFDENTSEISFASKYFSTVFVGFTDSRISGSSSDSKAPSAYVVPNTSVR